MCQSWVKILFTLPQSLPNIRLPHEQYLAECLSIVAIISVPIHHSVVQRRQKKAKLSFRDCCDSCCVGSTGPMAPLDQWRSFQSPVSGPLLHMIVSWCSLFAQILYVYSHLCLSLERAGLAGWAGTEQWFWQLNTGFPNTLLLIVCVAQRETTRLARAPAMLNDWHVRVCVCCSLQETVHTHTHTIEWIYTQEQVQTFRHKHTHTMPVMTEQR